MTNRYSYSKQGNVALSSHFQVKEFASKSGSKLYSDEVLIDTDMIIILEKVFAHFNCSTIIISSGYRTKAHDIAVGGNGVGQHTLGKASDFICRDKANNIISAKRVCCFLEDLGVNGIGYINDNYTHMDTRVASFKWWGDETKSGSPSITRFGHNSFYTYFGIPKVAPQQPTPIVIKPSYKLGQYISNGIDYGYVFDHEFYANRYADLKQAFGMDKGKLFSHFLKNGMKEERLGCPYFNVKIYRNNYADLRNAFGSNTVKYYTHFCTYGYKENRVAF